MAHAPYHEMAVYCYGTEVGRLQQAASIVACTRRAGWIHPLRATYLGKFGEDGCPDFARLGVATRRHFGVHQFPVNRDLEDPALARNQPPRADVDFDVAFLKDFVCQTDSARRIVSNRAVFERNIQQLILHKVIPYRCCACQTLPGSFRIANFIAIFGERRSG